MRPADPIAIGKATDWVYLHPRFANRHGLIAGATGTGKTVTLQTMAEGLSDCGVPVFLVDAKGDLSGLCAAGAAAGPFVERARQIGLDGFAPAAYPTLFWDVFGAQGHPARTTISDIGPVLLSHLLELNDTQEGVLHAAFAFADDAGLLLLDLKDLRAVLNHVSENARALSAQYGNISATSVGAIQRKLLVIEREDAEAFFGEPALALADLMRIAADGRGYISVLAADRLIHKPRLYATFLLWLVSELFEDLPEVGDTDRPRLVLFFDEAHLIFDGAPKALLDRIEQVVRLVRSKGVGVFFVTQNPTDIPDDVLGQLGNRVQHALRAFTAKDQKAVRAAAETFRANPAFATAQVITELGVGEALISVLEGKGTPSVVERALVTPPRSRVGAAGPDDRRAAMAASPVASTYDQPIDRESAYEHLVGRVETRPEPETPRDGGPWGRKRQRPEPRGIGEEVARQALGTIGREVGRQLVRGILGSLLRGGKR